MIARSVDARSAAAPSRRRRGRLRAGGGARAARPLPGTSTCTPRTPRRGRSRSSASRNGQWTCSKYSAPSGMRAMTVPLPGSQDPLAAAALRRSPTRASGRACRRAAPSPASRRRRARSRGPSRSVSTPEPVEHVLVDDRELLDRVVDPDRPRGQPEVTAQPGVGDGRDAGGAVAREVDGHRVRGSGARTRGGSFDGRSCPTIPDRASCGERPPLLASPRVPPL